MTTTYEIHDTLVPFEKWEAQLPNLKNQYGKKAPFPHYCFENFLEENVAKEVAKNFPELDAPIWMAFRHYNEDKFVQNKRELFPHQLRRLADELNSPRFLTFLRELTGIEGLVADPRMEGGRGMHLTRSGGYLNIHADFTMHHHQTNWRRRLNLILYLNEDWKPEWGGAIELWDKNMRKREASYSPLLNNLVVFSTDDNSFHGYPDPLRCPEDRARKSLALYYYSEEKDPKYVPKSTNYRPVPTDSTTRRFFIWFDNRLVQIYTILKRHLKFTDGITAKILALFSQEKFRD